MAKATWQVLVDWNNDGDYSDTGEDVTTRTLEMEWRRGRDTSSQLTGRSVAGRLKLVLNNESGDYSSFNTSSPLAGNLLPGRKVRINAGSGSFPYTFPIVFNDKAQWVGFIERIIPIVQADGPNLAEIEAVGPLGFVNQKDVSLAMATNELTGTAIGRVLDEIGWASADRTLDAGKTTMNRFWTDKVKGLTALRKVEETDSGFLVESKDGKIAFEDRHHRLLGTHPTSQATFSDGAGVVRNYLGIEQEDPLPLIFNDFQAIIQLYTVGTLAVLWTLAESGSSSPILGAGESKSFWATFPNPDSATDAFAVDAWTTPVSTTDYTANSASDGSGTNLTASIGVTVSKFGNAMKITLTNNHASLGAYITLLQARGTPLTRNDPILIREENSASQTKYGERTYPSRAEFIPSSSEALDWANYNLGIYKDPNPFLILTISGNRNHSLLVEALTRDISDRITIVATGNAGLGINEDFFIEAERHIIRAGEHQVTWLLSPAADFSDFLILDTSLLDTGRLAY